MALAPYVTSYSNLTVAQELLLYLGREGVTKVFGIPGGGLTELLIEFKNQRQTFEYVVCRHETGAAYIADGFYRATGTLGVVMVTTGPGATNALTGAMTAQNDGSGLLLITGEVPEQFFGKGYLQEGVDTDLDIQEIYRGASVYSAQVSDPSEAQTLIEQALRDAMSIPRGMAHLAFPNNVPSATLPTISIPNSHINYRATPDGVDHGAVVRAMSQLASCQRPLIFVGSGCRDALRDKNMLDKLVIFVESYGIPVMTTPDGKGVFPEDHPLSLRVYGFASNTWAPMWMQQKPTPYDGLLVLGTSLRGLSSNNFNPMLIPANNGPFIQVDLNQQAIGRAFPVTQGVVGEVGAFINQMADPALMEKYPPVTADVQARKAEVASIRQNSPYYSQEQYDSTASPIEPAAICRVLKATLPDESLIFLDAGNCVGWGIHYYVTNTAQEVHSSLAMGPMGFAVGAVLGAKMGRPDKTCVALVGDGAFMMHGAEVSTAQAHNVGAIWIVLDDADLHMVSQGMQYLFPDPNNIWNTLYRLGNPDLVKFAQGLGADAYLIDSPQQLQDLMPRVIDAADNQNRPQVIVAKINQSSLDPYFPPKAPA
jgi:acetolactate synthase-1/2/3 large subunit